MYKIFSEPPSRTPHIAMKHNNLKVCVCVFVCVKGKLFYMLMEPHVKWFDADWSRQMEFLLLFSNKGKSLSLSKSIANMHQSGAVEENWSWGHWNKRGGCAKWKKWGARRKDRAGICQKPIIILVQKKSTISGLQINITLLRVWEYIKNSSNWLFLMQQ